MAKTTAKEGPARYAACNEHGDLKEAKTAREAESLGALAVRRTWCKGDHKTAAKTAGGATDERPYLEPEPGQPQAEMSEILASSHTSAVREILEEQPDISGAKVLAILGEQEQATKDAAAAARLALSDDQVHIELVAVAKRAHRSGLAAELASVVQNDIIDRFSQLGRDHLLVTAYVHPENVECQAFCKSAEFARTATTGSGYDVWSSEHYLIAF